MMNIQFTKPYGRFAMLLPPDNFIMVITAAFVFVLHGACYRKLS